MEATPGKTINELEIGMSAEQSKTIAESDINLYAGITGDFNPIHINEEYAKTTRFGARIAHGGLIEGLIAPVIGMKLPGPGTIALERTVYFKAPVKIGDTITASAVVEEKLVDKNIVTIKLKWRNQRKELVMEGIMKVMPPRK
ncbi:MAG: MaoC family dehydratase [Actinomycetota bacterium]|nr:MaoC family dehydratase [Actinomycetota bacterium]